jgi:hypothetical protein
LFDQRSIEANAIAGKSIEVASELQSVIVSANRRWLFLQRIYSENSSENCGASAPLLPRVITLCHLHCPPPVRSVFPDRPKYAM